MTPLTWHVFFDPSPKSARVVQQWLTENAPFFQTQEGAAYLQKINHIKTQYINNEKWYATYGQKAGRGNDYNKRKNQLVDMFKATRGNIQNSPGNIATHPAPTAAPAGPAPAAPVAAAPAAPPVYLPTVNAPQYRFPSADAVRDMTYDPGIGGYLRPNQWQPGVPSNPYGQPPTPGAFPMGGAPQGPPQFPGLQPPGSQMAQPQAPVPLGQFPLPSGPTPMQPIPPGQLSGSLPYAGPQAPQPPGQFPPTNVNPGQFPWHPGY